MTIHSHSTTSQMPHVDWEDSKCPHCGSDDIDTIDSGLEDEYYVYRCVCNGCNCEFDDWYNLRHAETTWEPPMHIEGDDHQDYTVTTRNGDSVSPDPLGEVLAEAMTAIHRIGYDAARNLQGQKRNGQR